MQNAEWRCCGHVSGFFISAFFILHSLKMSDSGPSPLLLVISAPSAGGKTTLCSNYWLIEKTSFGRSLAQRASRELAKKDGVDYIFSRRDDFSQTGLQVIARTMSFDEPVIAGTKSSCRRRTGREMTRSSGLGPESDILSECRMKNAE